MVEFIAAQANLQRKMKEVIIEQKYENMRLKKENELLKDKLKQQDKHIVLSIETILTALKWANHMLFVFSDEKTKKAHRELLEYGLKYYKVEKINKLP